MAEAIDLQRFLDAQAPIYGNVVAELSAGRKRSHWMWFIFPQIAGLGLSPTSVFYALGSLKAAAAYADHPVLGSRLSECTGLMLGHKARPAVEILGKIDALKFHSSMTLFCAARPEELLFAEALEAFFAGASDPQTLARV